MHHISQLANQRKEAQCFTIRHCELLNKSGFNASETIYLAKVNKRTQEIALDYCKKSNDKKLKPWNIISLSSAKAREESKKSK